MVAIESAKLLVQSLLTPVLSGLNIKKYTLEIDYGTTAGDGYASEIWKVKVLHQGKDIDLIVKSVGTGESHNAMLHLDSAFRNEINFCTKVFPAMDSLQRERKVKAPLELAKCYATSSKQGNEALVLENLKVKGFTMCDRLKPFDETHVTLVLQHYAKLHALSLALHDQRPETFEKVTASITNVLSVALPSFADSFKMQINRNAKMFRQRGLIEESRVAEKIATEFEDIIFEFSECSDRYVVVTHGDCWCNNMMFKYDVRLIVFEKLSEETKYFVLGNNWTANSSAFCRLSNFKSCHYSF